MSLIVEDGTGKASAESYISVVDATAYHAARGNAAWGALASDNIREQLLRKATDAMVQMFRGRWAGMRVSMSQALDWPRYNVPMKDGPGSLGYSYGLAAYYPSNTVPVPVANACAEMALRAISGDLIADGTQPVIRQRVRIEGVVDRDTEFQPGSANAINYRAVESMVQPFLKGSSGQISLARA